MSIAMLCGTLPVRPVIAQHGAFRSFKSVGKETLGTGLASESSRDTVEARSAETFPPIGRDSRIKGHRSPKAGH